MVSMDAPLDNSANIVPFYLQKADRAKAPRTVNIFEDQKTSIEFTYKDKVSPFFRYLLDCYFTGQIATEAGFAIYAANGEKL